MSLNNILPICYRCDNKYKDFLLTSIRSVLKYYKGDRLIKFYICTNDDLNLDELVLLKHRYTFEYEIISVNSDFLNKHNITGDHAAALLRKFIGFSSNTLATGEHNKIYTFNPFNRSKFIVALWVLFIITTEHEKVLFLDTDTLVVDDITELFETDVSNYCLASCKDWIDTSIFNPSVSVINIKRAKQLYLKFCLQISKKLLTSVFTSQKPFCDVFQNDIINKVVGKEWLVLSQAWNMPVTHIDYYDVEPKIYHFCESWRGLTNVSSAYTKLVAKYIAED